MIIKFKDSFSVPPFTPDWVNRLRSEGQFLQGEVLFSCGQYTFMVWNKWMCRYHRDFSIDWFKLGNTKSMFS